MNNSPFVFENIIGRLSTTKPSHLPSVPVCMCLKIEGSSNGPAVVGGVVRERGGGGENGLVTGLEERGGGG